MSDAAILQAMRDWEKSEREELRKELINQGATETELSKAMEILKKRQKDGQLGATVGYASKALAGLGVGSFFGPPGMFIGLVVGGAWGLVSGREKAMDEGKVAIARDLLSAARTALGIYRRGLD